MSPPPQRPGLGGNRPERKSGGFFAGLIRHVLTLAAAVATLYYLGFLNPGPKPLAPAGPAGQGQALQDPAPPGSGSVEQTTTASIHKQQLALAKVNQRQLIATYDQLTRTIDEWEKELRAWEQEGPALLTNEAGRKLASDKAQVARFRGMNRVTRPGRDQLTTARQTAEDLVRPIRESLANPEDASIPDSSLTSTLQKIVTEATQARDGYRQSTNAVRAMLAQVKDNAPGQKTLEEALGALDQEEDAQRVAAIDAEEKKAKDEAAKKVAAEKAALAKALADAEADRIKGETERTKQNAQMAAAKRKQEADIAAAKSIEEQAVRLKEAEAENARQRDLAEQKRQGDLKAGSVWKGNFTVSGNEFEGTMTIESRVKDKLKGGIVYKRVGERGSLSFTGTVNGTSVKLTPTDGEPASNVYECVYQPAAKTISGQSNYKAFSFRLSEEKDE